MAPTDGRQRGRGRVAHLLPLAQRVLLHQPTPGDQQTHQGQTGAHHHAGRVQVGPGAEALFARKIGQLNL